MFLYTSCYSSIRFDAMCMNICHLCHPGWTELHTAVCSGDKECVEQLENRMSVDAADGSGPKLWRVQNCKVLYSCCWEVKFQWRLRVADQHLVCVLFSGFVRHSGRTPLHLAASEVSEPAKAIELLEQPAALQPIFVSAPKHLNKGGSGPPPPHRPQFAALFPATWLRCRWFCGHLNDWLKWAVAPSKPSDDRASWHWQAVRKWLKWAHSIGDGAAFLLSSGLKRLTDLLSTRAVCRLMSKFAAKFLSLEFGLRLEMQGSGGWPAECRSSTGRIWLVIHFAIVIEFGRV